MLPPRHTDLNDRQTAYLRELARLDVEAEAAQRAAALQWYANRTPARLWRAIEYGPQLPPSIYRDAPLRAALRALDLVSEGSGSTWRRLEAAGLVHCSERSKHVIVAGRARRVKVLHVALTRQGRKLGRGLLSHANAPAARDPAALSAGAWRILAWVYCGKGGSVPLVDAWWETGGSPPGPVMLKALASKLVKLGLATSGSWSDAAITEQGRRFMVDEYGAYLKRYPFSRRWLEVYGFLTADGDRNRP